jgi:predicted nucleotidyltransferase
MIMSKEKIMNRLSEHYKAIESEKYDILGVFLYGSQNYDLAYEGSDIDSKAIIIPNFESFVTNKKPVSKTHEMPNDEHVDVKDIRLMFNNFLKQNINFVEMLFTDYMIINPKYEHVFNYILGENERIARYNIYKTLNCISGMSMQKLKALEHPYPTIKEKIDKYGYDP